MGPRLTAFPLRCLTEAVAFDPAGIDRVRKIYVRHTDPPLASLQPSFDFAVAAGWETHELSCGHDLMLAAPAETAAVLDAVARRPG